MTQIRAQQLATTPATKDPSKLTAEQLAMKQRGTASCVAEKKKKKKLQQSSIEAEDGYRSLGRGGRSQVRAVGLGAEAEGERDSVHDALDAGEKKKAGAAQSTDAAANCRAKKKYRAAAESVREAAADSSCRPVAAISVAAAAGEDEELLVLPRRLVCVSSLCSRRWRSEWRGDGWNGWIGQDGADSVDDPMEIGRCKKGCSWTRP